MFIRKFSDGKYYMCKRATAKRGRTGRLLHKFVFLCKRGMSFKFVEFPKELQGKRIMIRIEVV